MYVCTCSDAFVHCYINSRYTIGLLIIIYHDEALVKLLLYNIINVYIIMVYTMVTRGYYYYYYWQRRLLIMDE